MLHMCPFRLCRERGRVCEKFIYWPSALHWWVEKEVTCERTHSFFLSFNASVCSDMLLNKILKIFKGIKASGLGDRIKNVLVYNRSGPQISEVKDHCTGIQDPSFLINILLVFMFSIGKIKTNNHMILIKRWPGSGQGISKLPLSWFLGVERMPGTPQMVYQTTFHLPCLSFILPKKEMMFMNILLYL